MSSHSHDAATTKKRRPLKKKPLTRKELLALYTAVRDFCRRERRGEEDNDMVYDWKAICCMVGIDPEPAWGTKETP